jgi:malate dehydrogenase
MKISLIGGGNIGGTLAHLIALKKLANEILILDINDGVAKGKTLDIAQCLPMIGSDVKISGTSNMDYIKDSSVIIITAGLPRKPGMSRDDLINTNAKIINEISAKIALHASQAFVIVVTNPLDAMVWCVKKVTGFNSKKVVGMAGILDTTRMNYFLAEELNVSVSDVHSLVLGSHGDSMVPLIRYSTIAGIPLQEYIDMGMITQEKVNSIIERTKNGGGEIVQLFKTGSAYYAPATSAIAMAESYINDQKRILPCSVCLNGYYGVDYDVFSGVPVVIGKNGVEKIIELNLNTHEKQMFNDSILASKELTSKL